MRVTPWKDWIETTKIKICTNSRIIKKDLVLKKWNEILKSQWVAKKIQIKNLADFFLITIHLNEVN